MGLSLNGIQPGAPFTHTIRRARTKYLPVFALAITVMGLAPPARAQEKEKAGADVAQLLVDVNDIDYLRPLIPLKLTTGQMDKMAAAITASQAAYEKRLKAIAGPALAKLADSIHDVKQKALKGEPIPPDFDSYTQAAEKQLISSRAKLDQETIVILSATLEDILTPEQVKIAANLDKNAQIRLKKVPATTQKTEAQWFASYVTDAVFTVPRIVPLLKEMRAASSVTAASTTGGESKAK